MSTYIIGAYIEEDAEAVRALYADSVKRNKSGFIQDLSHHGDICDFGVNMRDEGGFFAVGKLGGDVVSIGVLRPESETHVEMCKLHLQENLQGKGYGKQLALFLEKQATSLGFSTLTLHVTATQEKAIGLYQYLNFSQDHREVWAGDICGHKISFDTLYMSKQI